MRDRSSWWRAHLGRAQGVQVGTGNIQVNIWLTSLAGRDPMSESQPTHSRSAARVAPRRENSITLWGAPASGKTTFLAALNVALTRNSEWTIRGASESDTYHLSAMTDQFVSGIFPQATMGTEELNFILEGELPARASGKKQRRQERLQVGLGLRIIDSSGELFSDGAAHRRDSQKLADRMAASTGIALFFDPIREASHGDAYSHFHSVAAQLEHRVELVDGRLPHRLAVCIAKFDDPAVLTAASKAGHLVTDDADPYQFPRVADDRAEKFFEELCLRSPNGRGTLFRDAIRRYFHPSRTRYFATSSAGFYVGSSLRCNSSDCANVLQADFQQRLRGVPYPINVLEPLAWLVAPEGQEAAQRRAVRSFSLPAERWHEDQTRPLPGAGSAEALGWGEE
jgi:Double-GTPase 1